MIGVLIALGWGGSLFFVPLKSSPVRGCFLCVPLLGPPSAGYVVVSEACGLGFVVVWGVC